MPFAEYARKPLHLSESELISEAAEKRKMVFSVFVIDYILPTLNMNPMLSPYESFKESSPSP